MSKTKAQIGTLALQMLRVVEGDSTPDTNDTTIIEEGYDEVYARLRTRHLVSWGSTGSVPNECIMPVAALVADSRIGFFQVPIDAFTDVKSKASRAEGDLTEVLAQDYVPQTIQSEPL